MLLRLSKLQLVPIVERFTSAEWPDIYLGIQGVETGGRKLRLRASLPTLQQCPVLAQLEL